MVAETGIEPVIFGLWARRDTTSPLREIVYGTATENRTPVTWMKTMGPNH